MLTIRLTRKGKKNQPFFKLVVIDKRRSSKGGRAVEDLGFVDPLTKRKNLVKDRILYWISKGAKPSATVNNLLVREKIIEGKAVNVSKISKSKLAKMAAEKAKATPAPTPAPAVETPVVETPVVPAQSPAGNEAGGEPTPVEPSASAEATVDKEKSAEETPAA